VTSGFAKKTLFWVIAPFATCSDGLLQSPDPLLAFLCPAGPERVFSPFFHGVTSLPSAPGEE